jgi:hypothetical protein
LPWNEFDGPEVFSPKSVLREGGGPRGAGGDNPNRVLLWPVAARRDARHGDSDGFLRRFHNSRVTGIKTDHELVPVISKAAVAEIQAEQVCVRCRIRRKPAAW